MLPFRVIAATYPRFAVPPRRRCVRRLPRLPRASRGPGRGELCVKIPPSLDSHSYTSPKTPSNYGNKNSFQISGLYTLSFSVSSKSFACHSYENSRVCTNNSHSGTRHSPLITPHCTQVLSFHILAHSFARTKISTFLFSSDSALFAKKHPGGGGVPKPQTFKHSNLPTFPHPSHCTRTILVQQ